MERLLLIICVVFGISSVLSAQPIITRNQMPAAGDSIRYSINNDYQFDYEAIGENLFWDLSDIEPNAQRIDKYVPSTSTPYFFYFFNAFGVKITDSIGLGPIQFQNIFNFYRTTNNRFVAEGIGLSFTGFPLAANYSQDDIIYAFPLKYNDQASNNFAYSLSIPTLGAYAVRGTRTNTVEAWGKVKLPIGTFNCIKVKSVINQVDSINLSGFGIGLPSTISEYKFLSTDRKGTILEVRERAFFGISTVTDVLYQDIKRRVPKNPLGLAIDELRVYPNPSNQFISFDINSENQQQLNIFDSKGAIVDRALFVNYFLWPAQNYPAGIYHYWLVDQISGARKVGKVVVY